MSDFSGLDAYVQQQYGGGSNPNPSGNGALDQYVQQNYGSGQSGGGASTPTALNTNYSPSPTQQAAPPPAPIAVNPYAGLGQTQAAPAPTQPATTTTPPPTTVQQNPSALANKGIYAFSDILGSGLSGALDQLKSLIPGQANAPILGSTDIGNTPVLGGLAHIGQAAGDVLGGVFGLGQPIGEPVAGLAALGMHSAAEDIGQGVGDIISQATTGKPLDIGDQSQQYYKQLGTTSQDVLNSLNPLSGQFDPGKALQAGQASFNTEVGKNPFAAGLELAFDPLTYANPMEALGTIKDVQMASKQVNALADVGHEADFIAHGLQDASPLVKTLGALGVWGKTAPEEGKLLDFAQLGVNAADKQTMFQKFFPFTQSVQGKLYSSTRDFLDTLGHLADSGFNSYAEMQDAVKSMAEAGSRGALTPELESVLQSRGIPLSRNVEGVIRSLADVSSASLDSHASLTNEANAFIEQLQQAQRLKDGGRAVKDLTGGKEFQALLDRLGATRAAPLLSFKNNAGILLGDLPQAFDRASRLDLASKLHWEMAQTVAKAANIPAPNMFQRLTGIMKSWEAYGLVATNPHIFMKKTIWDSMALLIHGANPLETPKNVSQFFDEWMPIAQRGRIYGGLKIGEDTGNFLGQKVPQWLPKFPFDGMTNWMAQRAYMSGALASFNRLWVEGKVYRALNEAEQANLLPTLGADGIKRFQAAVSGIKNRDQLQGVVDNFLKSPDWRNYEPAVTKALQDRFSQVFENYKGNLDTATLRDLVHTKEQMLQDMVRGVAAEVARGQDFESAWSRAAAKLNDQFTEHVGNIRARAPQDVLQAMTPERATALEAQNPVFPGATTGATAAPRPVPSGSMEDAVSRSVEQLSALKGRVSRSLVEHWAQTAGVDAQDLITELDKRGYVDLVSGRGGVKAMGDIKLTPEGQAFAKTLEPGATAQPKPLEAPVMGAQGTQPIAEAPKPAEVPPVAPATSVAPAFSLSDLQARAQAVTTPTVDAPLVREWNALFHAGEQTGVQTATQRAVNAMSPERLQQEAASLVQRARAAGQTWPDDLAAMYQDRAHYIVDQVRQGNAKYATQYYQDRLANGDALMRTLGKDGYDWTAFEQPAAARPYESLTDYRARVSTEQAGTGAGNTIPGTEGAAAQPTIEPATSGAVGAPGGAKPIEPAAAVPPTEATPPAVKLENVIAEMKADPTALANPEIKAKSEQALLNEILQALHDPLAADLAKSPPKLTPQARAILQKYADEIAPDLLRAKMASHQVGRWMQEHTVANTDGRWNIDNVMSNFVPFSAWTIHTGANLAQDFVDKPALYMMYARMQNALDQQQQSPDFPSRLRGQVKIPLPFVPKELGGGAFINPLATLFPAESVFQIDNLKQASMRQGLPESTATATGAENAQSQDSGLNLITSLFAIHMPYQLAWSILSGHPDQAQNLVNAIPAFRIFRAATAPLVPGGATLPGQKGAYDLYYTQRALAELMAEGKITKDDYQRALIEQKGPAWQQAQQRMGIENYTIPTALSSLGFPGKVFSQGEQKYYESRLQRNQLENQTITDLGGNPNMDYASKTAFLKAHGSYDQGQPLADFYKQHPELGFSDIFKQGQTTQPGAKYTDAEQYYRDYIQSSIWRQYTDAPLLLKKMIALDLGDSFKTDFLDKTSRDYGNVDTATLEGWLNALRGKLPDPANVQAPQPAPFAVKFPTDAQNAAYQKYDQNVQQSFKNGWADVTKLENAYYALPAGAQRRAFLAQNPDLKAYWDYSHGFWNAHPDIAELLGKNQAQNGAAQAQANPTFSQFITAAGLDWNQVKAWEAEYFALPSGTGARTSYLATHSELARYFTLSHAFTQDKFNPNFGKSGTTKIIYRTRAPYSPHVGPGHPKKLYLHYQAKFLAKHGTYAQRKAQAAAEKRPAYGLGG